MKTRNGFVSNSSSSSFVISKSDLTSEQIIAIRNFIALRNDAFFALHGTDITAWTFQEDGKSIKAETETCMTDEIKAVFDEIGVADKVKWGRNFSDGGVILT